MTKPSPAWKPKSKKRNIKEGASLPSADLVDDPLSALTRIAVPMVTPIEPNLLVHTLKKPAYDRKFRSQFFFNIDPSIAQHIELLRKQEDKARLDVSEPLNKNVEDRAKTFNRDVAGKVDKLIKEVSEYFLTELSPLTMAAQGGVAQAREVMQIALNTDVEQASVDQFDSMLRHGVQMKMARYIARYLGLSNKDVPMLMEKLAKGNGKGGGNDALIAAINHAMNAPGEKPAGANAAQKKTRMDRIRERIANDE